MVTEMNDDSTPSRDKDHSSRLNGDLEDSSGRVISSSAVVKSEVGTEQKVAPRARTVQAAKERQAQRNNVSTLTFP